MSDLFTTNIRKMTQADLETVLTWRNHKEVRRFMFTKHEISEVEHNRWFDRISADPRRHLLIYQVHDKALGFVNIHEIAAGGIADWGFYTAPDAPRGTGNALGHAVLRYAFQILNLHKLCGQAIAFNERSIRLHMKLGFLKEGVLQHQHFDGQNYHDVWCFGLLAESWHNEHLKEY
ncbi:UDP-4-amino-4,6-dideoxy-N-acetyl-beta-L-altrosamine N-acetyltransferase [Limnobacter sp.]